MIENAVAQDKTCACGGTWPDNHTAGCTSKEMSKLWPSAYEQELMGVALDTRDHETR